MGLLEQGNTSGPLLLDMRKTVTIQPLAHVLVVLQQYPLCPPSWEMTTFVRVGIPTHSVPARSTQTIHSGMVRVVVLPSAVSLATHQG